MREFHGGSYDVAVIGAGHAGIEAALAAARMGMETICLTVSLDAVGNMPCNPAIGGTGKGHLVRELDALGGEMARAADKACIQYRMLNRGKGPAVWSLRAQADRRKYQQIMKHTLELQPHLTLRQAEVTEIRCEDGHVTAVVLRTGAVLEVRAVILCTGTYLTGQTIVGECIESSGPDGLHPANALADSLRALGLPLRRFKTGTPSRVNARSLDFDKMEVQPGDDRTVPFSFETDTPPENKVVCHITYTNAATKQVILDNLDRSPMYSGKIEGKGPRYCPSFEDKVVRFSDRERHQLFVEPCGEKTEEMYLQGLSSSLPEDVQLAFIHTIPGLEHAQVMRTAYAIEYDCVDPRAMKASLEFHDFPGLFGAGQFNGSSGYEEAAAQGLVAGINAAMLVLGREPLVLDRGSSYIGTLIDDLVTKGCTDPYRMMTSRSEYRLVLRQDNADRRLTPTGYRVGLISQERYDKYLEKQRLIEEERQRVAQVSVPLTDTIQQILTAKGTAPLKTGCKLEELLRRPQLTYADLAPVDPKRPDLPAAVFEQVEIGIKYAGYIARQEQQIKELRRVEAQRIPADIDYSKLTGLRLEAKEKLAAVRPENLGQAARISGVNPADVAALHILLESL